MPKVGGQQCTCGRDFIEETGCSGELLLVVRKIAKRSYVLVLFFFKKIEVNEYGNGHSNDRPFFRTNNKPG